MKLDEELSRDAQVAEKPANPEDPDQVAPEPESAAAWMSERVLTVRPDVLALQARQYVRAAWREAATSVYVYVVDDGLLLGVVAFRDLMLAEADVPLRELMATRPVSAEVTDDQEEAARLLRRHRLSALPVVEDGALRGVITADQVADIDVAESTEDATMQGGSEPLEVPYLQATPWQLWRKRIVWLLLLFAAEAYTGTVLRNFEAELDQVVALAFFVPLLIGTGGNTGTQISTTVVRALAVGDIGMRDVGRVLRKEITTAGMIAAVMAAVAFGRAWMLGVGPGVAITVTLALAAIVVWSAIVSSVLPPVLRKLRVDPAVVSAPFITTLVDGTGLIIYFEIAKLVLF